jgi:hypothetical protein
MSASTSRPLPLLCQRFHAASVRAVIAAKSWGVTVVMWAAVSAAAISPAARWAPLVIASTGTLVLPVNVARSSTPKASARRSSMGSRGIAIVPRSTALTHSADFPTSPASTGRDLPVRMRAACSRCPNVDSIASHPLRSSTVNVLPLIRQG